MSSCVLFCCDVVNLPQEKDSHKNKHESLILCSHVDSLAVTMKCPFCLDASAIFRGGKAATSIYGIEVCGQCVVLIRQVVPRTHAEGKEGATTRSQPIRTVQSNSSSLLQQPISETQSNAACHRAAIRITKQQNVTTAHRVRKPNR